MFLVVHAKCCRNLSKCFIYQARPLLEEYAIEELIDPRLGNQYLENEVYCMLHAASLCIRRDPHSRPRMSQVNKFLNLFFVGKNCFEEFSITYLL